MSLIEIFQKSFQDGSALVAGSSFLVGITLSIPILKMLFLAKNPKDWGEERRKLKNIGARSVLPPGVDKTEKYVMNSRGMALYTQRYFPKDLKTPKAIICMCHGYADSSNFHYHDHAVEFVKQGYGTVMIDFEGHGKSDGLHALVPDFDRLVQDAADFFDQERAAYPKLPHFLYGESMGGAVAVKIALKQQDQGVWKGMILQAPMCGISEKMLPPKFVISLLRKLAGKFPGAAMAPTANVNEMAFKVPAKREEFATNPWCYTRKLRLKTAAEFLDTTQDIGARLSEISLPFLLLHGKADKVTEPEVSQRLYDVSASKDKTFNFYDGMWHALLMEPECDKVWADIFSWLKTRC